METQLTPDERAPMIIHAVVLRILHEAFCDPDRYMRARGALRWLASHPFDEVDNLAGFLHTPAPTSDDFIRGTARIHPSVFEEIERAFAEGRGVSAASALAHLTTGQLDAARRSLDLSNHMKPSENWHSEPMQTLVHRAIENLVTALRPDIKVSLIDIHERKPGSEEKGGEEAFKVRSLRPVLYHIRSLYANGLNNTADAALNHLLNGDLEGARRAVSGIAPGDMEHGGFAGRQVAAQLDMEDRHRGNRRTDEAPDAQPTDDVETISAKDRAMEKRDRELMRRIKAELQGRRARPTLAEIYRRVVWLMMAGQKHRAARMLDAVAAADYQTVFDCFQDLPVTLSAANGPEQSEGVYEVRAGRLSKLYELITAAAHIKVEISPTMADEGGSQKIIQRAFVDSQVLIKNAHRLMKEIVGEERSDGAQTNCAQGPVL
jgi:hypothetical protein